MIIYDPLLVFFVVDRLITLIVVVSNNWFKSIANGIESLSWKWNDCWYCLVFLNSIKRGVISTQLVDNGSERERYAQTQKQIQKKKKGR
jgi:hypothetical protein